MRKIIQSLDLRVGRKLSWDAKGNSIQVTVLNAYRILIGNGKWISVDFSYYGQWVTKGIIYSSLLIIPGDF